MTCLFSPHPDDPTGSAPAAMDRRAGHPFTLVRLLRAFLALNLAVGVCVAMNSIRAESSPESFFFAGPLWLVASRNFTEVSLWYLGVTVVLAVAMSMPVVLLRWWTVALAIAAAAYWLSIGVWVAIIASC